VSVALVWMHVAGSSSSIAVPAAVWPNDQWWTVYGDTQLNALIDEALKNAPDLDLAQARLKTAAAQVQGAGATLLYNSDKSITVNTFNPSATGNAAGNVAGSICRPKKKKKVAANKSRSGARSRCDCSAIGPDNAIPTRNAPIAADTRKRSAKPATSSTVPNVVSRMISSDS